MKVIQHQTSVDTDQSAANAEPASKRKLILHFDQHNTIQVAYTLPDSPVLTVETGLNNFLTSAVWGKEIDNKWVWACNEPQLTRPVNEPDAITYFKYLGNLFKKHIVDWVYGSSDSNWETKNSLRRKIFLEKFS